MAQSFRVQSAEFRIFYNSRFRFHGIIIAAHVWGHHIVAVHLSFRA